MGKSILEKAKKRAKENVIKEYFKEDLSSERGIALKRFFPAHYQRADEVYADLLMSPVVNSY